MTANTPMDQSQPADPSSQSSPQPITDNPQAMKCVDDLKAMGYTADDVEQAMGGGDDQPQGDGGAMATKAAPMQIPSMG
jgi:hypothetical protein